VFDERRLKGRLSSRAATNIEEDVRPAGTARPAGAKVITHARYTVFQMAEVAVPRELFRRILDLIDDLRPKRIARC
jgi:hypothetical protein